MGNKTQSGKDSSDCESSDNAMEETPESLQDDVSSPESQPSSLVANSTAAPPGDAPAMRRAETAAQRQSSNTPEKEKSNAQTPPKDETQKETPAGARAQHPATEDTKSRSGSGQRTPAKDPENPKPDKKTSKTKKDTATTKQLDQNTGGKAHVTETEETNKSKAKDQKKQNEATEQKMVFGKQTPPKVKLTKLIMDRPSFCC